MEVGVAGLIAHEQAMTRTATAFAPFDKEEPGDQEDSGDTANSHTELIDRYQNVSL